MNIPTNNQTNGNDRELDNKFEKAIEALPVPIRQIIATDAWKPWVGGVVKKNNLNLDQGTVLETEVFMLMIGISNIAEMRTHLKDEARLSESTLTQVITDVNEMILDPLKQQLIDKTMTGEIEQKIETKATEEQKKPEEKKPEEKWLAPSKPNPIMTSAALNKNSVYDAQKGIFVPAAGAPLAPSSSILETKLGSTLTSPTVNSTVKVVTPPSSGTVATATPVTPATPKPISIDPYKEQIS